ncbi:MAG: ABC transporter permease [Acidimicrobiia bacterium]
MTAGPRRDARAVAGRIVQWCTSLGLFLAVWEWWIAPRFGSVFMAPPSEVWAKLRDWQSDGVLVPAAWETLSEALVGLALGSLVGVAAAVLLYRLPRLNRMLEPLVVALYAMPKIALVPLLFIWLGRDATPRLLFVSLSSFSILFIATATGLRTVDPHQLDMVRRLGASYGQVATKLLVPHSLGFVASGLAIAGPFALVSALVVQMLQGTVGLGELLVTASGYFDAAGVMAATAVATALGLALNQLTEALAAHHLRRRQT